MTQTSKNAVLIETTIYPEKKYKKSTKSEKIGLKNLLASWQPLSVDKQLPDIKDIPIDAKGAFE